MTGISRREVTRLFLAAACGAAVPARFAFAWAPPDDRTQFAVASIRPSDAVAGSRSGITSGHGMLSAENVTVKRCIIGAYNVGPQQVVGGPNWIATERWEIRAKADSSDPGDRELGLMLQSLLADRFKLVVHRDTRTIPAYVLEVAGKAAKMEKSEGGQSVTNTSTLGGDHPHVSIEVRNTGMDTFAEILSRSVDLPVVNQTGLDGLYNFTLNWTPDNMSSASQTSAENITIYSAIQEQLGLRLRAARTPVPVLVVDSVERPSEN